jgi:hypothetical protein
MILVDPALVFHFLVNVLAGGLDDAAFAALADREVLRVGHLLVISALVREVHRVHVEEVLREEGRLAAPHSRPYFHRDRLAVVELVRWNQQGERLLLELFRYLG